MAEIAAPPPVLPQITGWRSTIGGTEAQADVEDLLAAVFRAGFPLPLGDGTCSFEYIDHSIEQTQQLAEECIVSGDTFVARIHCRVRHVRDDSPHSTTGPNCETIVFHLPAVSTAGTCVTRGEEGIFVTQRRLAPGAIIAAGSPRLRPSNSRGARKDFLGAIAVITSDLFRQVRLRHSEPNIVEVDFGDSDWMPVTVLFRSLGATTVRDFLHLFCVERTISESIQLRDLQDSEVLARDIRLSTEEDAPKILLHRAGTILERDDVRRLVADGVECSVYRWRERVLVRDLDPLPSQFLGRLMASDVVDDETGTIVAQSSTALGPELVKALLEKGVLAVELEAVCSVDLIQALVRTWQSDKTNSRSEALARIVSALDFTNYGDDSSRRTIDAILSPPRFSLVGAGRHRFESLVGRGHSGIAGLTRDDIAAAIARVLEVSFGHSREPDSGHLENFFFFGLSHMLQEGLRTALQLLPRIFRSEHRRLGTRTDPAYWASRCQTILNQRMEAWVQQHCTPVGPTERDRPDGIARQVVDIDPSIEVDFRVGSLFEQPHSSWYGTLCLVERPRGNRAVKRRQLAKYAQVNSLGEVISPLSSVWNSKPNGIVVWLSAAIQWNEFVMSADQGRSFTNKIAESGVQDRLVECRYKGEVVLVPSSQVKYRDITADHALSLTVAQIPFLFHTNPDAISNGSEALHFAETLRHGEPPRVIPTNYGTELRFSAASELTQMRTVGKHLRVAYLPWNGLNFRKGIVVSQGVIEEGKLTSVEHQQFRITISKLLKGAKLQGESSIFWDEANSCIERPIVDSAGIVKVGSHVDSGSVLVSMFQSDDATLEPEMILLQAIFPTTLARPRDVSITAPVGLCGIVVNAWMEFETESSAAEIRSHIRDALMRQRDALATQIMKRIRDLLHGKFITRGLRTSGQSTDPVRLDESKLRQLSIDDIEVVDIRVTDPKTNRELRRISELFYKSIDGCDATERYWSSPARFQVRRGISEPTFAVSLSNTRKLKVGDVLRTRHGGGGTIAAISPNEDMPVLPDGRAVELLLSPLALLAEERLGELIEIQAAEAAEISDTYLAAPHSMTDGIEQVRFFWLCSVLNSLLVSTFSDSAIFSWVKGEIYNKMRELRLSSFSQLERAKDNSAARTFLEKLKQSIEEASKTVDAWQPPRPNPVKSLTLDEQLSFVLGMNGVERDARYWLRDGRSGETFEQPITAGLVYVTRVSFEDRSIAQGRSTGHYSMVSQEPLPSDTFGGGQLLRGDAALALAAHGAAHTLREGYTTRSDDIIAREDTVAAIQAGENLQGPVISAATQALLIGLCGSGISVSLGTFPSDAPNVDTVQAMDNEHNAVPRAAKMRSVE